MLKRRVRRHAVTQPLDKSYRYIALTQRQVAIVDAADFEWLSQWCWHAIWSPCTNTFYAARNEEKQKYRTMLQMHRVILDCRRGEQCDHINHDTLDNRRSNLRKAIGNQNNRNSRKRKDNTSGYKGVCWHKWTRKWSAQITINRKHIHLGYFDKSKNAAHAYDEAAKKYFGEFALLNFPPVDRAC